MSEEYRGKVFIPALKEQKMTIFCLLVFFGRKAGGLWIDTK